MKQIIERLLFSVLILAAGTAFGAVPSIKVTVFDAGSKVAFKGAIDGSGTFSTGNLKAGSYVVQFNAPNATVKGNQYLLVVSAGSKKVSADGVAGEKFLGGGVAMRVEVGSGLKIMGQVADSVNARIDSKSQKRLVWARPRIGSNMPGRWVPEDSAEAVSAYNSGEIRREDLRKWQDHGDTPH
jgi:hypothetical protein